jgi:hypothetical protein
MIGEKMSIQMDTWIDTTSYAQWKKGCKRKLSKSKQGSKAWKAAVISGPAKSSTKALAGGLYTSASSWQDAPQGPPIKLFAYERIDHRHSTYRQISILSWHISIEHSNRNPCR